MKQLIFLLTTFCAIYGSVAQEVPKILPPSPNAASLGKYGQVPVGLFTGTPKLNIPIYTLSSGKLTLPLSLDYSSNGIKVDEISSNVGYGWNLNAGGVITRVIMDDADELQKLPVPVNFPSGNNQETLNYLINSNKSDDGFDTKPDSYYFNFNGYSGAFYLDNDKNPILTNPSPLVFSKAPGSGYAFKIIDPNGVIYWFGNENSTEISMYQNVGTGQHGWSLENATSWYLSKIENTYGDQINFTYTNPGKIYYSSVSQSVSRSPVNGGASFPGQGLVETKTNVRMAQLSDISGNNWNVDFLYSDSNSGLDQLDNIIIRNSSGTQIKKIVLDYTTVTSSLLAQANPDVSFSDEYANRLFLNKVTEYGSTSQSKSPYILSYYNPDKIPPRFSYAQDYWGYYNGKHANKYLISGGDYYFEGQPNGVNLQQLFRDISGDKTPNGTVSKNGMLKKIVYPTGGYNELIYEPHSYLGEKTITPSDKGIYATAITVADDYSDSKVRVTEEIPFDQQGRRVGLGVGRNTCWERGWPDHKVVASVLVEVAEKGSDVFKPLSGASDQGVFGGGIYSYDASGRKIFSGSGITRTENDGNPLYYMDLKKGNRYRFRVKVNFECLIGDFSFSYYDKLPYNIMTNFEVGGQRLKKTITDDGQGKKEVKTYHYADLSCLDCSSGVAQKPRPSISYNYEYGFSGESIGDYETDKFILSSSTMQNLFSTGGHQIGYTSVIEEIGEDFGGGGIVHKFRVTPNNDSFFYSMPIAGTPFDTNFGTGEEIETSLIKKVGDNYITHKNTVNTYRHNSFLDHQRLVYNVRLRNTYPGALTDITTQIQAYDVSRYYKKSNWRYISERVEKLYDDNGQNPVTTTTKYFHENPKHKQVTVVETVTSDGNKIKTKTFYPDDVTSKSALGYDILSEIAYNAIHNIKSPDSQNPTAQNRVGEPIQTIMTVEEADGTLLSKDVKRTNYKFENNLVLPYTIKTVKGISTGSNKLNERVIYHKYDDKGNPLEVAKVDGVHSIYIWGYDQQYPIAKIENASYSQVSLYVSDLKTKSNADTDRTYGYLGKEGVLRQALDNLRTNLPNAMITTYTYDPLIGVTSMTDFRGYTMYYEYDDFQRLEYIKDAKGHLLSKNQYHYKNQN